MMKGLTLPELSSRLLENKKAKRDYIADTRDQLEMVVEKERPTLMLMGVPGDQSQVYLSIDDRVHNQIGSHLKIPREYYQRMQAKDPSLLASNVNAWFYREPERRMVRTMSDRARAFLSDRYQRIDNEHIAEVALPVLSDIPDVQFVSTEVTDRRMYIQAVCPRVTGEVKKGDVVQAGVVISNSEVGAGSVSVQPLVYRLICLNGMISEDGRFRARHVGRRAEDTEQLWADDTRRSEDRTILLKVRDMVRHAVSEARFSMRVEQMRVLAGMEMPKGANPAKAVEVLCDTIGATEEESGGILRALIDGRDLSAWGMLNAVTAQAHSASSYDRAVELEMAGGQLLSSSAEEWRNILAAD